MILVHFERPITTAPSASGISEPAGLDPYKRTAKSSAGKKAAARPSLRGVHFRQGIPRSHAPLTRSQCAMTLWAKCRAFPLPLFCGSRIILLVWCATRSWQSVRSPSRARTKCLSAQIHRGGVIFSARRFARADLAC